MRRITELEKRVAGMENRRPFQLRYFLKIESKQPHEIFDRARVDDEYFIRLDEETENQFCDRIVTATDANYILMFPHSIESDYMPPGKKNITQSKTQPTGVSKSESGDETPGLTPTLSGIEIAD